MDSERRLPNLEPEDIFAEAIARIEAGESLEIVLAAYPAEHQAELRDLLQIVALASQIQHAPVPRPSAASRAANKQAFLQAAAELRVERAVVAAPIMAKSHNAQMTFLDRWQALWQAIQAAFTVRTMRLAPLIVVMALVWLSSFSLVTLAQEALPGDIAYPMKQWMRYQELNLSPPSLRPQVLEKHEKELHDDILKAAEKAEGQAGNKQDLNVFVIKTSGIMTYHGDEGYYLVIGGLQVLKKYQPDANKNQAFIEMAIEGKLTPGKQVVLEYQILATQNGNVVTPIVQGIALRVLETAPVVPTPVPTKLPTPTNTSIPTYTPTPVNSKPCVVNPIAGWRPVTIFPGDNLATIALRTNTSVASLMIANCLKVEALPANGILLAPELVVSVTPTSDVTVVPSPVTTLVPTATNPTGEATLTPTTPAATLTATDLPVTTTVIAVTPTAQPAEQTATVAATAVVTATSTAEATPNPPASTPTRTFPTVTELPATATATQATAEPTTAASPASTPLSTATVAPLSTPEPSATSTSEAPTPAATATPTLASPSTPVDTPTAADTPTVASSSVSTASPVPTTMPTPTTAPVEPPTATPVEPTPIPPTPIPPTPIPPTPIPPTPIPPTPIPPTPIPPTPIPPTPVPPATEASSAQDSRFRPHATPILRNRRLSITPTPVISLLVH